MSNTKKKIIIVGGGAGGLELAAKLSTKFKKDNLIEISLVDKQLKHVWKPLYHEVAAGTYSYLHQEIDYISYAYQKDFTFILGPLKQINRKEKWILVDSLIDNNIAVPERKISYDILILAIGSKTNDFNIPGVTEHCLFLDSLYEAEICNKKFVQQIILSTQNSAYHSKISIIGGGATGVESAAEFNYVVTQIQKYEKLDYLSNKNFQISIYEASKNLLDMLPIRISQYIEKYLESNKVHVSTNTKITEIKPNGIVTKQGKFIESSLIVWAAGVKGNASTINHDLEVNHVQQFKVKTTLQTTLDSSIFAFGDCASCPQRDKKGTLFTVPPRAQAAHQQASFLVTTISNYLSQLPLPEYHYKDYGSLISLSRNQVIGYLMGKVAKSLYIEGLFARIAYWSLYKQHMLALKGFKYVILSTLAGLFLKKQRPEIKLH
jgi:NADH:ubiquinone reductase (H+-translocating)